MNPTIKKFLIISLKNAVNAVIVNTGLMTMFSGVFTLHNWAGIIALLKATGIVIFSREVLVWGPKLMRWSQTDAMPNGDK